MDQKEILEKMFPKLDILTSNHDVRFFKRLARAGIPRRFWPTYEELFECKKGWKFHDSLEIDGVMYVHGHQIHGGGGNIQQNGIKAFMKSVVFGHYHTRLGIDYLANQDNLFFGMACGCLIDHKEYAFQYQRASVRKPLVGVGLVLEGLPVIEPMLLDADGRWVGRKKR
jgi:hypothetical protein